MVLLVSSISTNNFVDFIVHVFVDFHLRTFKLMNGHFLTVGPVDELQRKLVH